MRSKILLSLIAMSGVFVHTAAAQSQVPKWSGAYAGGDGSFSSEDANAGEKGNKVGLSDIRFGVGVKF